MVGTRRRSVLLTEAQEETSQVTPKASSKSTPKTTLKGTPKVTAKPSSATPNNSPKATPKTANKAFLKEETLKKSTMSTPKTTTRASSKEESSSISTKSTPKTTPRASSKVETPTSTKSTHQTTSKTLPKVTPKSSKVVTKISPQLTDETTAITKAVKKEKDIDPLLSTPIRKSRRLSELAEELKPEPISTRSRNSTPEKLPAIKQVSKVKAEAVALSPRRSSSVPINSSAVTTRLNSPRASRNTPVKSVDSVSTTPLKTAKQGPEQAPSTPTRKSRRLSGSQPIDSPILPIKKRRTSFSLVEAVCEESMPATLSGISEVSETECNKDEDPQKSTILEYDTAIESGENNFNQPKTSETQDNCDQKQVKVDFIESEQDYDSEPALEIIEEEDDQEMETEKNVEEPSDTVCGTKDEGNILELELKYLAQPALQIIEEEDYQESGGLEAENNAEKTTETVNEMKEKINTVIEEEEDSKSEAEEADKITLQQSDVQKDETVDNNLKLNDAISSDSVEKMDCEDNNIEAVDSEKKETKQEQSVKSCSDSKNKQREDKRKLEIIHNFLMNKIPRQKPKSGKFWKDERNQFRSLKKDKGKRKTFEDRLRMKEEKKLSNELASQFLQEKISKKIALKERIEENKKRREERELKSEQYQIVTNPNKIKKLKKRDLVKRDVLRKV